MKQQLLDAWAINNRVNLMVIDELSGEALAATLSKRGGRTIAQQLAHVHNVRRGWLEVSDKALFKTVAEIPREDAHNRKLLKKRFEESGRAMAALFEKAWDNGGQVKGFTRGLIPMVGYLLAHEAHHRGQLLLTAKQCGFPLSDTLKWGIWDWAKLPKEPS